MPFSDALLALIIHYSPYVRQKLESAEVLYEAHVVRE